MLQAIGVLFFAYVIGWFGIRLLGNEGGSMRELGPVAYAFGVLSITLLLVGLIASGVLRLIGSFPQH